jgi:hypothetical protein
MKKLLLIALIAFGMNAMAQQHITVNKDTICLHGSVTVTTTIIDTTHMDTVAYCEWNVYNLSGNALPITMDTIHNINPNQYDTLVFTHTYTFDSIPGNWQVQTFVTNQWGQPLSGGGQHEISIFVSQPLIAANVQNADCGNSNGSIDALVTSGAPPYVYTWSNGSSAEIASGLHIGTYTVTVIDNIGCTASKSGIAVTTSSIAPAPSICMVTVDSISQHNVIIWDKTSFAPTDSFIVYREIGTNNYMPIGEVPYSTLSLFVDTVRVKYFPNTGNPNSGTYRYKLGLMDSCGNKSLFSPYHNTIYMLNNSGAFSWSQLYTIEGGANPVISYILMRDDNNTGNWHAVNSVSGTQQTVIDPSYITYENTASWRVVTQWNITCTPSKKNTLTYNYMSSLSNVFKGAGAGINDININSQINIYPNPANDNITVENTSLNNNKDEMISIYNIQGQLLLQQPMVQAKTNIDIVSLVKGMYYIKVKTVKGIAVKKFVKE